ncbi:MAG: translocation/assembly module TamB domain-containing protein [Arcobacter sp.]|uniref:translocation/assembly module TamB domain-containing protein n=1 Tax=Arcobacter sp. TaxID=1872629 RepID=UPI002A750ACF|nr:translocation/assembly module TamB domain-containing protein [Arcobacter sp.]MDY3201054.1 translocation/assembly module TamB domain-containing protein [Arcobacter sp.]
MKILKFLFISIIALFLVAFLYLINSSFVVQKIFDYISKEVPLKYTSLKGTLYSGISIKDLNYENNLVIKDFYIKPELLSLLVQEIYIKELKIDGITLDNKLFETTQNQEEKTTFDLPFKLIIKKLEASIYNYSYEDYKIEELFLKSKNITSDLNSYLSGDFEISAKSNIANLTAFINLNKNNYTLKSNIEFIKEFLDKNIIENLTTNNFNLEANGNLEKINFQINSEKLTLKANKPIDLKNINTTGTYDFSTFNLDITNLNAILNYDFINSNIEATLSIKNNDINSLVFNSNLNTLIKKDILKNLQKDLLIKSQISGNLKEIKFTNNFEANSLKINDENIKIDSLNLEGNSKFNNDNIDIFADLNLKSNILRQKSKIELKLNSSKIEDFLIKAKTVISEISYQNIKPNSIGNVNINTTYKKNSLDINLESKLADLSISSKNLKKYLFDLNIKKINPNEFYKLDEKIKISNLKGKISAEYEDDLNLKGNLVLNNSFDINTNLFKNKEQIKGKVSSKSFETDFSIKDEKTTIKAQIKELKDFEKELNTILEMPKLDLKGLVDIKAQIDNSEISFELDSSKISFEKEAIQKIDIKGTYKDNFISFNTLNFYISKIYDINFEKNFSLKNQAILNIESLSGNFDFDNILISTSKENEDFNIKIDTKDLAISYDNYGKGSLSSNLLVQINPLNKVLITGEVRANKLYINYETPSVSISKDKDIIIVYKNKNKKEKDTFFEDIALQLSIFADNLTYKVKNIDLKASSILFLKKDFYQDLKIFGSLQDTSGTFTELGKSYTIKDSNIYFRGLEPIDPLLDIHATYSVNDIDISIIISGSLNEPRINLTSTPVMSQKDILSYLIFGTTFSSNAQTNTQSKQSQASLFLLNELSKDYAKELGIDMLYFQYDPTTQYIETYVGKNISQRSKIVLKNKSTGGELILMRELTKLWNIELGFEEDTQSLDLIYRKRY